ncbi:MAG TPA: hypothetical protein VD838_21505, partial [Anaeromyxobacteraceae bacterium]|nr:hypothetical protein [Anaeromyxobacteraceae bacterium]
MGAGTMLRDAGPVNGRSVRLAPGRLGALLASLAAHAVVLAVLAALPVRRLPEPAPSAPEPDAVEVRLFAPRTRPAPPV